MAQQRILSNQSNQPHKRESEQTDQSVPQGDQAGMAASASAGNTLSNIDDVLSQNSSDRSASDNAIKRPESDGGYRHPGDVEKSRKQARANDRSASDGTFRPATIHSNGSFTLHNKSSEDGSFSKNTGPGSMGGRSKSFMGKHKKKFGIGGGIALIIIGAIISIIMLLPLKLESMIKNVIGHEYSRVEDAMGRRLEIMVERYLVDHAGIQTSVVIEGGPLQSLFASWKTTRFETSLETDYGIKVERGKPGTINISGYGVNPKNLDESALHAFLNTEASGKEARAFIKESTRAQTRWFQVYKRRNLRRYLRHRYAVKKWKIFDKAKDDKAAATNLNTELSKSEIGAAAEAAKTGLPCLLEDQPCPDDSERRAPNGDEVKDGKTIDTTAKDKPQQDVADSLNKQAQGATDSVTQGVDDALAATEKEILPDLFEKILSNEIAKKALGPLGLIQMASEIDNAIANNSIGRVIAHKNALQYASVFASWATMADQIKAGDLSTFDLNAAMKKLDGMEKAQGYENIYNNKPKNGVAMANNERVNQDGYQKYADSWVSGAITGKIHIALAAYRASVGKIVKLFGDLLTTVTGPILGVIGKLPGISNIQDAANSMISSLLNFAIGPVVDGKETGAKLFNAVNAGGDVTANGFARDQLGGVPLSPAQAQATDQRIADEQTADFRRLPLSERLASLDSPDSLASRLLNALPSGPQYAASTTGSFIATMLQSPINYFASLFGNGLAGLIFQPAHAASAQSDIFGVQQYGFTEATLNAPINPIVSKKGATEKDCLKADGVTPVDDTCLLDLTVVNDALSNYTNKDDGGLGDDGGAGN